MRKRDLTPTEARRKAQEHGWETMLALEKLLLKERQRYEDNYTAESFFRKEFATELAALAKANGEQP